jgi:hypothetical protein
MRVRPMVLVSTTASVVALITGILGLVFLVRPDLRPGDEHATRKRATLEQQSLEQPITRRAYLNRTDQLADGFTAEQLAERGVFVRLRVHVDGFAGVPLTLGRELIDEQGEEVMDEKAFTITPPEPEVDRDWHDWVPLEGRRGRYFLTFKLLAPDEDAPLATLETDPVPGLG